ncbi:hypothetical protein F7725_005131 [Dissostichus mawsoni]|uniref:Uncharacterized protein n=1 Tax=Dissostichus mawsoni TaxID=36200 RepID=A0A7J5YQI6_DISMA|nr:hypothetical protein F7725_005131 [Dissostichus mawsoni]
MADYWPINYDRMLPLTRFPESKHPHITIDPQRINDEFRDYYASLYTSETSSDTQDLDNFFTTLETKGAGGLALPNFRFYYWATNLRIIQSWLQSDSQHSLPVWLEMEAASCSPISLSALAHSPLKTPSSAYTKNVIVKASLNIWNQFRRFFDLQTYSTLAP